MITTPAVTAGPTTGGNSRTRTASTTSGGPDLPPSRAGRGDIHVWAWRTGPVPDATDLVLLDEVELGRVRRCHHPRDAAALARTRAGARRALGGLLDVPPTDIALGRRTCPACGSDRHGPPVLSRPALPDPPGVSLSRTEGCGMLAAGLGTKVGIDVEALRPVDAEGLAEVVLTERERAHVLGVPEGPVRALRHFRCWTRKEAVVKAAGTGLMGTELTRLEVYPEQPGPVRVVLRTGGLPPTSWHVRDIPLNGPWTAALAHPATPSTPHLTLHTTP
ncbi:4'-phosphopantetheinyl transferase family protein [Streptomyces sp. NPDC087440]|uniref:4'-phosphopantetheinyl transferase family protein n=1 Tax=Streptomyces sp. NPDC087440 TaxID=3365790 RepID=UPI00381CC0B9